MGYKTKKKQESKKPEDWFPRTLNTSLKFYDDTMSGENDSGDVIAIVEKFAIDYEPENMISFCGGLVDNIIATLALNGTYTASITKENFVAYIQSSFKAASLLIALKKFEDRKNLKHSDGTDISKLFNGLPTYNSITFSQAYATSAATLTTCGETSASPYVWGQTYLSELPFIKLPDKLLDLAYNLYGVTYQTANNKFMEFIPNYQGVIGLSAVVDLHTAFAAEMVILKGLLASNPDLSRLLSTLGIGSSKLIGMKWDLDKTGASLNLRRDPDLFNFLHNNQVGFVGVTNDFTYDNDHLLLAGMQSSFGTIEQMVEIPADTIAKYVMFRGHIIALGTTVITVGMDIHHRLAVIPGEIDYTTTEAATQLTMDRIGALTVYFKLADSFGAFRPKVAVRYASAAADFNCVITNYESQENISDVNIRVTDVTQFVDRFEHALLFGANWRIALQSVLLSISTPTLSND